MKVKREHSLGLIWMINNAEYFNVHPSEAEIKCPTD